MRSLPCEVLLAEDNPADIDLVRMALSQHAVDCDLRVITDGDVLLAFLNRLDEDAAARCPDLLLLDMHLPKRDGGDILKRLRASPRCSRTPVVIFTSSDEATARRKIRAGIDTDIHTDIRAGIDTEGVNEYFQKSSSLEKFMQIGGVVKRLIRSAGPNGCSAGKS